MAEVLKSLEHPKNSGIRIREKINTSGEEAFGTSFAVTVPVKITGKSRVRKQFKKIEDAKGYAEKEFAGSKLHGRGFFDATDQERREFSEVVPALREAGISLREAVEFALPRLRPIGGNKTFTEVIEELKAEKLELLNVGRLREHSEKAFRLRSKKIEEAFGSLFVHELTADDVRDWLKSMELAPRTKKNELTCLYEVLKHSNAKKYVGENVIDEITKNERANLCGHDEDREPEILSPKEAERLLRAALDHPELDLLAAVTIGMFCGIRTEELKKLQWKDVNLDESFVTIGRDIAKKRQIRNVTIPENAKFWLSLCPDKNGNITRSNFFCDFSRRFNKLLKFAGFTETSKENGKIVKRVVWKRNGMRHSFGTYHFALYGDSIKTSNELGHRQGDNVLFSHYRALASKKQAEAYFSIIPPSNANKVVKFAS